MASRTEELWNDNPAAAFEEAQRRISEWRGHPEPLDFSDLPALERVPEEIARLSGPVTGDTEGLTVLRLAGTSVSGVGSVAELEWLDYLDLSSTPLSDISPLSKLRRLDGLDLSHTAIRDLTALSETTSLSLAAVLNSSMGLHFTGTSLDNDYLQNISRFENPARTVETINYLRRMQNLEEFYPEGYERPTDFPVPPDIAPVPSAGEDGESPQTSPTPPGGRPKKPRAKSAPGKGPTRKSRQQKDETPAYRENVQTQSDDPAVIDRLNRKPLAEVIARRMDDVLTTSSSKHRTSFAVHLDGAWGTGKSSILNFMREWLVHEDRASRRWIVVEFNAWENERINPPWWPLIKRIYADAYEQLHGIDRWRALRLGFLWYWWRAVMDWLPILIATGVVLVAWWLIYGVPGPESGAGSGLESGAGPKPGDASQGSEQRDGFGPVESFLKIAGLFITTVVAIIGAGRTMVFGSSRAAKLYLDMSRDPLKPVTGLFNKLITAARQPVAIFIDDLDRCNAHYVVDLLEGIQTMFRGTNIAYVVAADRKWLRRSFEKRYEDFGGAIGEPGRPLGYLFLEKIFQVSATVPRMGDATRDAYWKALLKIDSDDDGDPKPEEVEKAIAAAREKIESEVGANASKENLDRLIQREGSGLVYRVAAAQIITTSTAARAEAEHRLAEFSHLLPENPRFMKRLVNAYGLHQAIGYLEQRKISPESLARWTIIEQRWPALADQLTIEPDTIGKLARKPTASALKNIPEEIREYALSAAVRDVVAERGKLALTPADVHEVTGGIGY